MGDMSYAVVAYLPGRLGRFVNDLRRRLNPSHSCWLAHVTILPPRSLQATLEEATAVLRQTCAGFNPFEITVNGLSTFWPVNGVVFLSIAAGSQRLVQLHDALNGEVLQQQEVYPYVPHITIAQQLSEEDTQAVLADASQRWAHFDGDASFRVESLTLVQQLADNSWADLAPISLGVFVSPSRP